MEENCSDVSINQRILAGEAFKKAITIRYASVKFSGDGRANKNSLIRRLLTDTLPQLRLDKREQFIIPDRYGCPRLNVHSCLPLAMSISYNGQELWAAVAVAESLGIDVETSRNFSGSYPYDRAFMADDLHRALCFYPQKEQAAALLWSCKEAAMKERGTGFHFTDPRDVRILSCMQEGQCMYRVTVATPEEKAVVVSREGHLWLAVTASG